MTARSYFNCCVYGLVTTRATMVCTLFQQIDEFDKIPWPPASFRFGRRTCGSKNIERSQERFWAHNPFPQPIIARTISLCFASIYPTQRRRAKLEAGFVQKGESAPSAAILAEKELAPKEAAEQEELTMKLAAER